MHVSIVFLVALRFPVEIIEPFHGVSCVPAALVGMVGEGA